MIRENKRPGSIAGLPVLIRAAIRQRMDRGQSNAKIAKWLNALELARTLSGGRAITTRTVRRWREKGSLVRARRPLTSAQLIQKKSVDKFRRKFKEERGALDPDYAYEDAWSHFDYSVGKDWRRKRCALIAAACMEFEELKGKTPAMHLRKLIADKYRGALIALHEGRKIRLELCVTGLFRFYRKWQASGKKDPNVFQRLRMGRAPGKKNSPR